MPSLMNARVKVFLIRGYVAETRTNISCFVNLGSSETQCFKQSWFLPVFFISDVVGRKGLGLSADKCIQPF